MIKKNLIVNGILDEKVVRSCVRKIGKIEDGTSVTAIEGIGTLKEPHPLQDAWMIHGGVQCGFSTPGFIVFSLVFLTRLDLTAVGWIQLQIGIRDRLQATEAGWHCSSYCQKRQVGHGLTIRYPKVVELKRIYPHVSSQ